ncbi:hypothetical protein [Endozoicomonas sp. YOMI1]|uniref:hypothetical protein n=1 Tax=Endozoicomonas sp. YOMI1 TaxID=2828739 RepID=UPI0021475C29|nr:hypothetical protein [Endozoicomonas sp. YOMI1]
MIWKILFPIFVMSSALLDIGCLAAAPIYENKPGVCFLKNKIFNVVVGEEYSAPIRFGALEANSTKRDSVYFTMKGDDLHYGFTLTLNLTDPEHSRRLYYEVKNLLPAVRKTLPEPRFTRNSVDIIGSCDQDHFVIILPQAGNEFSFFRKANEKSVPHGSGLMVEGHLISSHLSDDSFEPTDKKLRVSFSSFADRLMEKKLSNLEEQPEVPAVIVELEEGKMVQELLDMKTDEYYHSAKMYEEKYAKVTRKDHQVLKDIDRQIEDLEKAHVALYKQIEEILRDFQNQIEQISLR